MVSEGKEGLWELIYLVMALRYHDERLPYPFHSTDPSFL